MRDASHLERWLQQIPLRAFVGRDDRAGRDPPLGELDSLGFTNECAGQDAPAALA